MFYIIVRVILHFCENPEAMREKCYFNEESRLPNKKPISAACAETLRQQDGANIVLGGWCAADSWFQSVMASVETKLNGRDITGVIKQNTHLFPKNQLLSVLLGIISKKMRGFEGNTIKHPCRRCTP